MNLPVAVALDSSGNVYISDAGNNLIRKVVGGNISTVVGGLDHPNGIAVDAAGNLYIADTGHDQILKFSGGVATTIAGGVGLGFSGDNGLATKAQFTDPVGVAVDAANYVYIADTFNGRIRKLSPDGIITTVAGNGYIGYSGDGGPAANAVLFFPRGLAVDTAGNVYVADTANHVIRQLSPVSPVISANGVVNSASFVPHISPGALATVFGTGLSAANASAAAPLPFSLAGVSVSVNGRAAPVYSVTPTSVNFQVPWETKTGNATVTLTVGGLNSNTITVPVLVAGPGLFVQSSGAAVVLNSDGTLNGPGNPAKTGSTIIAYVTGSGPVSPAIADGVAAPGSPSFQLTSSTTAAIGPSPALVSTPQLAPGFVGVAQLIISVPSTLPAGDYPLAVTIGGETSNAAAISLSK